MEKKQSITTQSGGCPGTCREEGSCDWGHRGRDALLWVLLGNKRSLPGGEVLAGREHSECTEAWKCVASVGVWVAWEGWRMCEWQRAGCRGREVPVRSGRPTFISDVTRGAFHCSTGLFALLWASSPGGRAEGSMCDCLRLALGLSRSPCRSVGLCGRMQKCAWLLLHIALHMMALALGAEAIRYREQRGRGWGYQPARNLRGKTSHLCKTLTILLKMHVVHWVCGTSQTPSSVPRTWFEHLSLLNSMQIIKERKMEKTLSLAFKKLTRDRLAEMQRTHC